MDAVRIGWPPERDETQTNEIKLALYCAGAVVGAKQHGVAMFSRGAAIKHGFVKRRTL